MHVRLLFIAVLATTVLSQRYHRVSASVPYIDSRYRSFPFLPAAEGEGPSVSGLILSERVRIDGMHSALPDASV